MCVAATADLAEPLPVALVLLALGTRPYLFGVGPDLTFSLLSLALPFFLTPTGLEGAGAAGPAGGPRISSNEELRGIVAP